MIESVGRVPPGAGHRLLAAPVPPDYPLFPNTVQW